MTGAGDEVWSVGSGGALLHSTDAGASWQGASLGDLVLDAVSTGGGVVLAAGVQRTQNTGNISTLMRSTDGQRWQRIDLVPGVTFSSLWSGDPTRLLAGGAANGEGALFESRDGGVSWNLLVATPSTVFTALWGSGHERWATGGGIGVLGYSPSGMLHSSDDGTSWSPETVPTDYPLHALWGNDSEVFAVGVNGLLLRRTSGQWLAEDTGSHASLGGVWGMGADLYAVGASGALLHRGAIWADERTGPTDDLYGIWASGDEMYAVGAGGTILHSADHGQTWSRPQSGVKLDLLAVAGSGPDDVFVSGVAGMVLRSTDRGVTWRQVAPPTFDALPALISLGPGRLVAGACGGGFAGAILRTDDGGASWSTQWSGTCRSSLSQDGVRLVAGGESPALLRSTDGGLTWAEPTLPMDVTSLLVVADFGGGELLGTSRSFDVYRSLDDAATWSTARPYPYAASGAAIAGRSAERFIVGGERYPGGAYGVLLHSNDRGGTWDVLSNAPAATVLTGLWIDDRVWIVGYQGAILSHL